LGGPEGDDCRSCTENTYCTGGTSQPISCSPGTVSTPGSSACKTLICPPGSYANVYSCSNCSQNFYCPGNASQPIPCQPGTVSTPGSSTCQNLICPPGSYANVYNCSNCSQNFYCTGDTSQPTPCQPGTFSTPGSETCQNLNCTPGYYINVHKCSQCPTNVSLCVGNCLIPTCYQNVTCPMGKYRDWTGCVLCPKNTYQMIPNNTESLSSCLSCPEKTNSSTGSTDKSQCVINAGYYINENLELLPCTPGFYCIGGITTNRTACPIATYSLAGQSSCTSCYRPGYYCPNAYTAPIPCPSNIADTCVNKSGFYGIPGQFITICPINNYCVGGFISPVPCINSFTFTQGSTKIEDCIANAGYVGYGNNIMQCPENFFCPAGSLDPFPCPTYSQSPMGSDDVEDCKAADGYYCNV
jgi:Tyrosine-protein kinase ephrin type A/B receptor-like